MVCGCGCMGGGPSSGLSGFPSHILRNNIFIILTFGAGWGHEQTKSGGGGM